MKNIPASIAIIGGGLSGSEAAWQLALRGHRVDLYEMRPQTGTFAHQSGKLSELVCSNSFRSDDHETNAVGLLHHELRQLNSLIIQAADHHALPAGTALAVDRESFAEYVDQHIRKHPLIKVIEEQIHNPLSLPHDYILIASGPLTSTSLSKHIADLTGQDHLAFFDAIAPIVYRESIDMSQAWFQSRYDKISEIGGGDGKDYLNCPMDKDHYHAFIEALIKAPKVEFKDFEKNTPYFEGCLPIEVMAERGPETLRFGPMKPVGLTNPHTGQEAYAVVQLRQDNRQGTLFNMVGFQTKMTYGAQKEVFKTIPGLEKAEFARLGGIHRNTFIQSPKVLHPDLSLKNHPRIHFAGQITGVEGYVESTAMGLLAGLILHAKIQNQDFQAPPATTSIGALHSHIIHNANPETFQPMNANFGLFDPIDLKALGKKKLKGMDKKIFLTQRAKEDLSAWCLKNLNKEPRLTPSTN